MSKKFMHIMEITSMDIHTNFYYTSISNVELNKFVIKLIIILLDFGTENEGTNGHIRGT